MSENRRRAPRYAVDAPVLISAGVDSARGRLRDICRDAALVEASRSWPLESVVTLEAEIPGAMEPIRVAGRVIRVGAGERDAHAMAVLFTDLNPTSATQIDFFIAAQERRPSDD